MRNLSASVLDQSAPVHLQRIEPGRNMARFYSMEVERDLFGRVVLVRRWGRLGTAGRTRLDEYKGEGEALAALKALHGAKMRRGYRHQYSR
ncbi:WGR domain-containing protein [Microvirga sp. HBU67558]|uniref:WGR domain-containing protein n=1 Tax=Microvirga sp. HBU67558 TaxID=2824562 RepID=UPI001B359931|nr:WGR domain-containing protein [Microvirga sp. HBU67558]MBQ0820712.1 WGR domain-containing protein [Microvirga sp. HBU67558]